MTKTDIKWAQDHDWYLGHNDNGVKVIERWSDKRSEELFFDCINELRIWAGY